MKAKFTVYLTLFVYAIGFSQVDTTAIPFVAYWSKGDAYDFKVTKIKQQWKEGQQVKNDSSAYVVNFQVIDSTEVDYTIKWSYKTNLKEFNIPAKLENKFAKYQMTEVIYKTNEVGEFIGIENWEEVAEMMKGLLTDVVDVLAEDQRTNREELAKLMQPLLGVYESKQGIEQLVFKELQYFHFPFGIEFSVTAPLIYEERLPNMLGGDPIRGDAKIYFDSINREEAFCVLMQEMQLNSEDTKQIITALFQQMNLDGEEMTKAMQTAQFDIQDYNKYAFYYYPGVPVSIETNRTTLIDIAKEKGKRVEVTRIELVE